MDPWNPLVAETDIKREPLLKVCAAMALAVIAGLSALWITAVLLLSLEKMVGQ